VAVFEGHEQRINTATFSRDSRLLATCSSDRTVRLWQIDPLTLASRAATDRERSGASDPTPLSPSVAALGDGTECQVLRGHTDEVFAAAFHPDGKRLASAGRDRAILLWDLERREVVARLPGHSSYIWSLTWSPDGKTLVSGSGD